METKADKILAAAFQLMKQHGYRKVTMSDIAEAVGISRPTLYAVFPNKEAIVDAYVARKLDDYDAQTAARMPRAKTLEAQLALVFEIWIIAPFASVADSASGLDLVSNIGTYVPATTDAVYARLEARLVAVLEPVMRGKRAMTPRELARILSLAARGMKTNVTKVADLRRLLDGLTTMCLATV